MDAKVNDIRISAAHLNDLPALIAIENDCFKSDRLSPRQMRYMLTRAKAISWQARSLADAKTVGYSACLTPVLSRPARLYSLAVLPHYRGRGIAGRLIEKNLQTLKKMGYRSCHLEVRKTDQAAQRLYEKDGFTRVGMLSGYYEDGEDGIKMICKLKVEK